MPRRASRLPAAAREPSPRLAFALLATLGIAPMTQPTTAITDYLLAAVALASWWSTLRRDRSDPQQARRMWAWAFAALALAAVTGGTYHGFVASVATPAGAALWKATVFLMGIMDLLMLCGSFTAALDRRWRRYAVAAAVAKFLVYAAWMACHNDYRYVVYDYAPSMLAILLIHALPGSFRDDPGARSILVGLLLSFVAAGVQLSRLTFHAHFNHNDLYHVIQIGAIVMLYRGARLLRDRPGDLGDGRQQTRVLPPVYFLLAVILMVCLHLVIPAAHIVPPQALYLGAVPLLAGFALTAWAARLFYRLGTSIKPFQPSSVLVLQGPYRLSRNPMYLGMVFALLGLGVLLGSLTPIAVVPLFAWFIQSRFIRREEEMLERTFGAAYTEYKGTVRRWL